MELRKDMMKKHNELVSCECGCGQTFLKYRNGKTRRFVSGHNGRKYPIEYVSCECGCGQIVLKHRNGKDRRFVSGHNKRRLFNEFVSCECGCGQILLKYQKGRRAHRFVNGHNMIGNKPTEETKKKLREARKNHIIPFKNSKPERFMQSILTLNGIDYEKHKSFKIGERFHQVDIFIKPNICIEIDGCYHHGCEICLGKRKAGFSKNQANWFIRDMKVNKELVSQGNLVMRFWGHVAVRDIKECFDDLIRVQDLIELLGLKKAHGLLSDFRFSDLRHNNILDVLCLQ